MSVHPLYKMWEKDPRNMLYDEYYKWAISAGWKPGYILDGIEFVRYRRKRRRLKGIKYRNGKWIVEVKFNTLEAAKKFRKEHCNETNTNS